MFDVKEKINDFKVKYKNKCFALAQWKNLQMKDYGMTEMLTCICNAANGSIQEMANIIDHLTSKKKVFGRTQVYGGNNQNFVDLVRNENGELELRGYNPDAELPLKGQNHSDNPKVFRKTDGQVNKNFQKAEERMMNLGKRVRDLFPNQDKQYITFAMEAIRKYAEEKKIHTDKVIKGLEKGRYTLDDEIWKIIPKVVKESKKHTIVINESDLERITDMMEMTEQKFFSNIKYFISQLLQDPVNAKVPSIFSQRGYTRSSLLSYLLGGKDPILFRKQRICDKDENGNPKKATMMVKFIKNNGIADNESRDKDYKCPKKNFDRKLKKLYIKMFEKNLPPRKQREQEVDEATTCGDSSGPFVTGIAPVMRRQMPYALDGNSTKK